MCMPCEQGLFFPGAEPGLFWRMLDSYPPKMSDSFFHTLPILKCPLGLDEPSDKNRSLLGFLRSPKARDKNHEALSFCGSNPKLFFKRES